MGSAEVPDGPGRGVTMLEINHRFYEPLWERSRLVPPQRFNTWPLVRGLVSSPQLRLEVAPGLSPRLPLEGTQFVDMSGAAVAKLRERGAEADVGLASNLPCDDKTMDLIGAFDIIEHVENDEDVLSEISRVAAPGATLLLSAPLHASRWTSFDVLVGHARRYRPADLLSKLARHGWSVARSGVYGIQPRSSRLLDFVVWSFQHNPSRAQWGYSRVILPLGAFFQKKLELASGMIEVDDVDEVLLVCERSPFPPS